MGNAPPKLVVGSAVRLDRQDPYLRLQSVTIYVRDLDHGLNFYLDQLGFQLIFDARDQPGRRWVTVAGKERLGFVIGDISGKGIAAALLMANLQANLRSQCAIALDQPQRLLRSVNQLFCENTPDGSFATLFFAEYDDTASRLRYANCGHLPALLLHSDETVERLEATATVLGIFKNWDCEIGERQLRPGDTLALYTDGITESYNSADEEFGEHRLIAALERHRRSSSQAALASIVEEVQCFSPHEQRDDITLIIAKHRGN
jgi:serine phosphatase RsbU (regulator of sigma subunit)